MSRTCPDCNTPLIAEHAHGVMLDACPTCAGIWFDEGEYGKIKDSDTVDLLAIEDRFVPQMERGSDQAALRMCPSCGMPMFKYRYLYNSPVVLDGCDHCSGIWVEDGELRKMHEALAATAPVSAKQAQRAELTGEAAIEYEAVMERQRSLRSLFSTLKARWPLFGASDA